MLRINSWIVNDLRKLINMPSYKDTNGVNIHFASYEDLEWNEEPIGYTLTKGSTTYWSFDFISRHYISWKKSSPLGEDLISHERAFTFSE